VNGVGVGATEAELEEAGRSDILSNGIIHELDAPPVVTVTVTVVGEGGHVGHGE
jgi:hypothetical protein